MDQTKIISATIKGDKNAQRHLYEQYKVAMFSICLRYARDRSEAEDILQEGFIKIFRDLKQFDGRGSLGGWMRRVMVNAALQYLRKWKREFLHVNVEDNSAHLEAPAVVYSKLGAEELTRLIQRLPLGYRTIFNLYVIEGYPHKEIAEKLGISENTSKTQLRKAKASLRTMLEKQILT
ncbi:MAG: RNA polymerase sigma factor [Bacteroidota bacterium]